MRRARLVAAGELIDHLAEERRSGDFEVEFELPVGLRDLVQSTGIPHVEVGGCRLDGRPAGWSDRVEGGATIELTARYPLAGPEPDPRFLLDVHLGKLARFLRLLGFDSAYRRAADDDRLAAEAARARRILLSRDRGLLMRGAVDRGRWIRATEPETQAAEVLKAFALGGSTTPFSRCLECNGRLRAVDPAAVEVPAGVRTHTTRFRRCEGCGRVYWSGSHRDRLTAAVDRILAAAALSS